MSTTTTPANTLTKPTPAVVAVPRAYRVTGPAVVILGQSGSRGIFYRDDYVTPWPCGAGDGEDHATQADLDRIAALGLIEPVTT